MATNQRVTVELVLRHLRKRNFAVLSTISPESRPHSVGVNYGVSRPGRDLALYVMTRIHLQKARNIRENPNVSLVIPLTRQVLWFLPPPVIQLHGQAEILDGQDEQGTDVFRRFWMGRRILDAYLESRRRGETRICFLKITPDPVVSTYMVGYSAWELRRHMESGAAKVVIPRGVSFIAARSRRWWLRCSRFGQCAAESAGSRPNVGSAR
jgi:general stress protein 26